jgi:hypothetical protein
MISGINSYGDNSYRYPSFGAVHPARFFVRTEGGEFCEVTSRITVDRLRKHISKMLNRSRNEARKRAMGIYKKSPAEKSETRTIREWLENVFIKHDEHYARRNEVSSFARTNSMGETKAFFMTGDSVNISQDAAQPISDAWRYANDRAEVVSDNLKISYEKAKDYLKGEREDRISGAKYSYFSTVYNKIREILGQNELINSHLDMFFDMKLSGKTVNYKLVDVKFNGN